MAASKRDGAVAQAVMMCEWMENWEGAEFLCNPSNGPGP
ncbi:MAG: hypothetical protein JWO91_2014 [Acidobacteriaceae bacterium]|nr:hypothetical protein [Acidobacteriaceae bacterium]